MHHAPDGRQPLVILTGTNSSGEAAEKQKTSQHTDHQAWGYEADNGPSLWSELNPDWVLCAEGHHQSPIDLTDAKQEKLEQIKLNIPVANLRIIHQKQVLAVLDNGHTIQIKHNTGGTLKIGDDIFELQQGHFHSPSEHTVNGGHYPMEMHLVHSSKDKKLAVIGVFIEEGPHNAAFDIV